MTNIRHMIYERPTTALELMGSIADGVASRFRKVQSDHDRILKIREFYKRSRFNEADEDIVDSASGYYLKFVMETLSLVLEGKPSEEFAVVDLGCGQATLHAQLLDKKISVGSYLGVDLYISDTQFQKFNGMKKSKLIECDYSDLKLNFRGESVLAVFVNSLCYWTDIDPILGMLDRVSASNKCTCLVVEPFPSFLWENRFGGFELRLRSPRTIKNEFARFGWIPTVETRLSHAKLGFRIWPFAYGLSFSKAENA